MDDVSFRNTEIDVRTSFQDFGGAWKIGNEVKEQVTIK